MDPGPIEVEVDRAVCKLFYEEHYGPGGAPEEVLLGKFHPEDFLTDVKTGM